MRTCLQTMDSLKVILPRELVSDGVLEYKIPSSTIWNRCSWVGTHFGNDVTEPYSSLGWQKVYCIVCVINLDVAPDFLYISPCNIPILMLCKSEKKHQFDPSSLTTRPPSPPLTKADRFPLVFRVSIMSSTIWNRLQCGGTINKDFASVADGIPLDGSIALQSAELSRLANKEFLKQYIIVGSLPYDIKPVEAAVVVIWCYITELNWQWKIFWVTLFIQETRKKRAGWSKTFFKGLKRKKDPLPCSSHSAMLSANYRHVFWVSSKNIKKGLYAPVVNWSRCCGIGFM